MPKVTFKFDKEKDAWNIWATATSSSKWNDFKKSVTPNIATMCEGKKFEECKDKLIEMVNYVHKSGLIEIYIEALEKSWGNVEKEYFKRMDKIMKKKFSKDIIGYITTSGRCPYDPDEPSFMVSLFHSLPYSLSTCGHEIMHLYFHKFYWENVEKKIGKEKTADLKEALTILLNFEFSDLWIVEDHGYDSHQELRTFIEKTWKKEKDFDVLLEKCVDRFKS